MQNAGQQEDTAPDSPHVDGRYGKGDGEGEDSMEWEIEEQPAEGPEGTTV